MNTPHPIPERGTDSDGRVRPIRIRLSRRKGFDLQALSLDYNGRAAAVVSRPSVFGNPFSVTTKMAPGTPIAAGSYVAVATVEDAVECFREMLTFPGERADAIRAALPELRGKNLACWCTLGTPCHADVLLELANAP